MMSTRVAPVAVRIESTFVAISAAVAAFDCRKLYDQLTSSASVQPSALNRPTMVVQVLLEAFHPCTNRIGSRVGSGFGRRALSVLADIGPVGPSTLHAASVRTHSNEARRVERVRLSFMR